MTRRDRARILVDVLQRYPYAKPENVIIAQDCAKMYEGDSAVILACVLRMALR